MSSYTITRMVLVPQVFEVNEEDLGGKSMEEFIKNKSYLAFHSHDEDGEESPNHFITVMDEDGDIITYE